MNFCTRTASVWQVLGNLFLVLKILIPLIMIVLAIRDLGRVVVGSDSDEKMLKSITTKIVKRLVAAVFIFFIPTLTRLAFLMVTHFSEEARNDFQNCFDCIASPNKDCDTSKNGTSIIR